MIKTAGRQNRNSKIKDETDRTKVIHNAYDQGKQLRTYTEHVIKARHYNKSIDINSLYRENPEVTRKWV